MDLQQQYFWIFLLPELPKTGSFAAFVILWPQFLFQEILKTW